LLILGTRPSQRNGNFTRHLAAECKVLDVHPLY